MRASALSHSLRRLRRGWRSGELLILALAVAVAVAAASAVGLFSDRIRAGLEAQTGEAFGADAMLSSRKPIPQDLLDQLHADGIETVATASFPSVLLAGDSTALASIKAVETGYPPRGELRISQAPFGEQQVRHDAPPPGEAYVELRLWQDLKLSIGSTVSLGETTLRVAGILEYEPERGGFGFSDLAPRVLINTADLDATGLITFGSRVGYGQMLSGPDEAVRALADREWPDGVRFRTPDGDRRDIRDTLGRADRFLDVAVLAVTLLAAAAVALSARQSGLRRRDEVALLKTLGADGRWIGQSMLIDLLLLGLVAGVAGALLGWIGQAALIAVLGDLLGFALPAASGWPLLWAVLLGLAVLLGFAAPPLLAVRGTPPLRVLQRDVDEGRSPWVAVVGGAAALALIGLQARDAELAAWVLAGAVASAALLAGLGWLLIRALLPLRQSGGTALRFGLGNIARRQALSVVQIVALGLALLSLYLVTVVRNDLLVGWRDRLPPDTPNQFLINIQPEQLDPLKAFFAEHGFADLKFWPMTRARLTALNGQPVDGDTFADPETRDWINREFNLSWTDRFGDDNTLIDGQWWPADTQGEPWLSVEDYGVERLGLKIGDTLTLQFADGERTLSVYNTRKTRWDSFRPNFFLVAAPGVLDGAPAQWLTSFYLPHGQRGLLPELIRAFPNLTVLDLDAAMSEVRSIVDRIVGAIEVIFAFTLLAGMAVLLAAMEASRGERIRESALLRTLGARGATIRNGLIAEYAVLGAIAGAVAALAAQGLAWLLATRLFELDYTPDPLTWIAGTLAGALLVALLGWVTMRSVIRTPPSQVLRGSA